MPNDFEIGRQERKIWWYTNVSIIIWQTLITSYFLIQDRWRWVIPSKEKSLEPQFQVNRNIFSMLKNHLDFVQPYNLVITGCQMKLYKFILISAKKQNHHHFSIRPPVKIFYEHHIRKQHGLVFSSKNNRLRSIRGREDLQNKKTKSYDAY